MAVAAGRWWHNLALKFDGTIVGWGDNSSHQATPPAGNDFVAIATGGQYSLALKSDSSIVGWGDNHYGQATSPIGNDFVAIAAGGEHSLALKSDGSIVGWGWNDFGQATVPEGNDFVAIAAGRFHSLALKSDGSIIGWGANWAGVATPLAGNNFVAIAASYEYSLALRGSPLPCAEPNIFDIPDQTAPFEQFDLDDYLDPTCGFQPNEVEWSVSGIPADWTAVIDVNNIVTITAPAEANIPATLTFTAKSKRCPLSGYSTSDDATFSLNRSPDCSGAYAEPACLWPANRQMVPIAINGITDPDSDNVSIIITSITSDEPTAAGGVKYSPDAAGIDSDTAQLRAECLGNGNGRVYVISFIAIDDNGGECEGTVKVKVPHDQRLSNKMPGSCRATDDGQLYDAAGDN
ncbi:MAG: hypothetical protein PHP01_02180 [Phycisphaerae bacterium]|nr:hypothetical protein [Phycisphaerae bacterium]